MVMSLAPRTLFPSGGDDDSLAEVHGRRDSSVLFSLDELSGPRERSAPEEPVVTETSGLLDIRAVARKASAGASASDPFAAERTKPAGPSFAFTGARIPRLTRRRRWPLRMLAAALVIGLGAALALALALRAERAVTPAAVPEAVTAVEAPEEEVPTPRAAPAPVEPAAAPEPAEPAPVEAAASGTPPEPPQPQTPEPVTAQQPTSAPSESAPARTKRRRRRKKPVAPRPKPAVDPSAATAEDVLKRHTRPHGTPAAPEPAELSRVKVRSTVKKRDARFRACMKFQKPRPTSDVAVMVTLRIKNDGSVLSAQVAGPLSGLVKSCLVRALKSLGFGRSKAVASKYRVPLTLR